MLLVPAGAITLEFKREEDRAELIRNMFKDRQIELGHADGMSQKAVRRSEKISDKHQLSSLPLSLAQLNGVSPGFIRKA
ncbi:hypothetical protein [Rickettsiales endosymbiont of Peranema trichophorum]|uniref:hypothetical protein n=1 Tax=Rickettsiales endosymbiont of Peranema trichophorum TaxID=2486577 RepID=UPI001023CA8A|nr:hypothetical protein [Rickettsiales endosymbiont of Peranema trichophorum]